MWNTIFLFEKIEVSKSRLFLKIELLSLLSPCACLLACVQKIEIVVISIFIYPLRNTKMMKKTATGGSSSATKGSKIKGGGNKSKDKENNEQSGAVEGEEEEEVVEQEDQDELADQIEAAMARRGNNIWVTGGPQKDAAIRMLIQCFGSMIESMPKDDALPDHRGRYRPEDMIHKKLLDASKQVVKAKRCVLCVAFLIILCAYLCLSLSFYASLSLCIYLFSPPTEYSYAMRTSIVVTLPSSLLVRNG